MAKYEEADLGSKSGSKYQEVDSKSFTPEKEVDNDPYRLGEAWTALKTAGKGVPIAGNFISEDEAMRKFAEDNPKTATGLKIAGGVGSMLVPGMAIGRLAGVGTQMMAGAGLGGLLGIGNNATNPDPNKPDWKEEGGWGALFGGLGPLGAKLLSPGAPAAKMPDANPFKSINLPKGRVVQGAPSLGRPSEEVVNDLSSLARSAGNKARDEAANKSVPHWLNNDANIRRLSSAALGASGMMTMGPYGIMAGIIPYTPSMARAGFKAAAKYPNSNWASRGIAGTDISTKDIVRALALQKDNSQVEP